MLRHYTADIYEAGPEPVWYRQDFAYAETASQAKGRLEEKYPALLVSEPVDVTFDPRDRP